MYRDVAKGTRLLPCSYVLFLSLMLPFTVSSASRRPPLPIVPRRLRGPSRPVTMRGKSVWMSPLTVLARTSVDSPAGRSSVRSEEHTSELQSRSDLVCRLLLEKKKSDIPHKPACRTRARHAPKPRSPCRTPPFPSRPFYSTTSDTPYPRLYAVHHDHVSPLLVL